MKRIIEINKQILPKLNMKNKEKDNLILPQMNMKIRIIQMFPMADHQFS